MKSIYKNVNIVAIALVMSLMWYACGDTYLGLEQHQTDAIPPQKPIVNEVIAKSGAIEIKFSLAKGDPDIAQVIASYQNNQGEKLEFTASRYSSSILLEGFYGTDEVQIEMVAVDNSGNVSEVTEVSTSPLLSPIEVAFQSLEASSTFGGVLLDWENTTGDLLIFNVLTEDSLQIKGQSVFIEDPTKRVYTRDTTAEDTRIAVRTFPPTEQKFGFVITDSWGNRTDTLISYLTPIEEWTINHEHIEALTWYNYQYTSGQTKDYDIEGINEETGVPNDGLFYAGWTGPKTLFDGSNNPAFYAAKYTRNLGQANAELVDKVYCTYDLGVDTRLSRMQIWWRSNLLYKAHSVQHFRFWGTNDSNENKEIQFPEGWTLIGEYKTKEAVNPNNLSSEEKDAANGMELSILNDNIDPNAKPATTFRYLRIEIIDSYDAHSVYTWNEIKLFGSIENTYY